MPVPDENSYIEREGGPGDGGLPGAAGARCAPATPSAGHQARRWPQTWPLRVSRVSGEPAIWEAAIRARLGRAAAGDARGGRRRRKVYLTRTQLVAVSALPATGRYHYADFVDLDTGRVTRIGAAIPLGRHGEGEGSIRGLARTVGAGGTSRVR